MYFVVCGQNQKIAEKELTANGFEYERIKKSIALVQKNPQTIQWGSVIKAGKIVTIDQIENIELIGTNNKDLGKMLKKQGKTRRFKIVELDHQDKEVKEYGKEVIVFEKNFDESTKVGEVTYFQDIPLFEAVDYEKPASGMNVGMMPSKLCLSLINIATGLVKQGRAMTEEQTITIYDPFVGFGTTCWLANHLNYNTVGSDIVITSMKQNLKRRKDHQFATQKPITVFKHDVQDVFQKNFLKHVDCIVTEGWLGPIQKKAKPEHEAKQIQEKVLAVYAQFVRNAKSFFKPGTVIVCTVPFYLRQETNLIFAGLEKICTELEIKVESIEEVYKRTKQLVGRQIVIITL